MLNLSVNSTPPSALGVFRLLNSRNLHFKDFQQPDSKLVVSGRDGGKTAKMNDDDDEKMKEQVIVEKYSAIPPTFCFYNLD